MSNLEENDGNFQNEADFVIIMTCPAHAQDGDRPRIIPDKVYVAVGILRSSVFLLIQIRVSADAAIQYQFSRSLFPKLKICVTTSLSGTNWDQSFYRWMCSVLYCAYCHVVYVQVVFFVFLLYLRGSFNIWSWTIDEN